MPGDEPALNAFQRPAAGKLEPEHRGAVGAVARQAAPTTRPVAVCTS